MIAAQRQVPYGCDVRATPEVERAIESGIVQDSDAELVAIAELAARACGAASGAVTMHEHGRPRVVAHFGHRPALSLVEEACSAPDVSSQAPGMIAVAPIVAANGNVLATVCVIDPGLPAASQRELVALELLAGRVVRYVELLLRNEELVTLRRHWDDVMKMSGIAMWRRDLTDGSMHWSGSLETISGLAPDEIHRDPDLWRRIVHPDDLPVLYAAREQLVVHGGEGTAHCRFLRPDGGLRHAQLRYRAVIDGGRPTAVYGTVVDVTELREREQGLSLVLERVDDLVVGFDRELHATYINRRAVEQSGRDHSEMIGRPLGLIFNLPDDDEVILAIRASIATQHPQRIDAYFAPVARWYEFRIFPSADGATVFGTDVTAEHTAAQAEASMLEQLRALTARINDVREEEAQRIARELHDELGQELTALKLEASWLQRHANAADASGRLVGMKTQIDRMADLVRRLATELRPQLLDDLGLAAAVSWQGQEFANRTGIACTVTAPSEPMAVSSATSVAVFRVLQEALTNVVRHAQASSTSVTLTADAGRLVLTVVDDGCGIPVPVPTGSLGLLGMSERMLTVDGDLTVARGPSGGTVVTATAPLGQRPTLSTGS